MTVVIALEPFGERGWKNPLWHIVNLHKSSTNPNKNVS